ncbi:hypothetical protein FRC04_001005 [Tulasnella sp. 424]|nr:hypothetical protein FRC04_001005 [Tulasnella sp. 424]KAG8977913.1 hypothetical protein FRC05_000441 [Tulasnella sp. 425]
MARTKPGSAQRQVVQINGSLSDTGSEDFADEIEVTKPSTSSQPRKPSSSNKTAVSKGGQKGRAPSQPIVVEEEDVFGGPAKKARPVANGKGKGKAPAQAPKAQAPVEDMEEDDPKVEEDTTQATAPRGKSNGNGVPTKAQTPADNDQDEEFSGRTARSLIREIRLLRGQKERLVETHERELQKLQKQNETLAADNEALREERDTFAKQFDNLVRLRTTEEEAAMQEFTAIAEEKASAQQETLEVLLHEKGLDELTKPGPMGVTLFTRAETDTVRRALEGRVLEKEDEIKEKMEKITELEKHVADLTSDMENERRIAQDEIARLQARERAASSRAGGSSPTARAPAPSRIQADQLKLEKEISTFLQDISGITILSVVQEKQQNGIQWKYRCLFTPTRLDALTFEVVVCPPEPGSAPDMAETIYTPLVKVEPIPREEFLEELNWLASPFSFQRYQLHMLGTSLLALNKTEEADAEGQESDDEVQMIED